MKELKNGSNMLELLEKYSYDPGTPKHFSQLKDFERRCSESGFEEAAEYVRSWRLFMEYHIKAEWND